MTFRQFPECKKRGCEVTEDYLYDNARFRYMHVAPDGFNALMEVDSDTVFQSRGVPPVESRRWRAFIKAFAGRAHVMQDANLARLRETPAERRAWQEAEREKVAARLARFAAFRAEQKAD